MDDPDIIRHIGRLVDEEHRLRGSRRDPSAAHDASERLNEIELTLDQCWDLLRQRRALRTSGQRPAIAATRSPEVVEAYVQ